MSFMLTIVAGLTLIALIEYMRGGRAQYFLFPLLGLLVFGIFIAAGILSAMAN